MRYERLVALRQDLGRGVEQAADSAGPRAGCVDDDVALESCVRRDQGVSTVRRASRRQGRGGQDPDSSIPEEVCKQHAVGVAVDVAVARPEQPAGEVGALEVGNGHPETVLVEHARVVDAQLPLDLDAPLERGEVVRGAAEPQIAVARDLQVVLVLEPPEEVHAPCADLDRDGLQVLRLDDADRETGGLGRDLPALDHGHRVDSQLGQVEGGAKTEGTGADHGYLRVRPAHVAARSNRSSTTSIVSSSIGVEIEARPPRAIRTPAR